MRTVADTLRVETRRCDHVGRFGGEEFTVLLPAAGRNRSLLPADTTTAPPTERQ